MAVLESLGTAVPGPAIPQADVKAKAQALLADVAPDLAKYLKVFDTTGIASRHFVRPLDWYLEEHGWKDRSDIYREEGLALLESSAKQALTAARIGPEQIDGIVFVSTTGISTPSLDARLVNRMGFRPDVRRTPVWGLGCAGGVGGLSLTAELARGHPDRRYLFLSLELCSLAFHLSDLDLRSFVAATLFSDGAAAAVVRGDDLEGTSLGRLGVGTSHEWKDSEGVMGWDVMDGGLGVVFSREIPSIVEREFAPIVRAHLDGATPDRYVFHPGGAKVIDAYQAALGVNGDSMAPARLVLQRYGNMSSPTVLFALAESLRRPLRKGESALLAALGPGFASELISLEG